MIDINNIALIALCGSRLFNLDMDGSDYDYLAIAYTKDIYNIHEGTFAKQQDGSDDYFICCLDLFNQIAACASPLIAPYYDSVVNGNSDLLKKYWKENASELADIWPMSTYRMAMDQVESYLTTNEMERACKIVVRLLGMMWCRYYTGDLLGARQLTPEWRERYFAAKRGELSTSDILIWYNQLNTPSIRRYFENEPKNIKLHDQYKIIIDQVLKEESE